MTIIPVTDAVLLCSCVFRVISFLADRTNGRAYATVLRPSVVVAAAASVTYVLWLNGAS